MKNYLNERGFVRKFIFYSLLSCYALISYWLLWPYEPMVVKDPIKILNADKKVKQGDWLIYELAMDKHMDVPCKVIRQIVDTFVITYAPIESNLPVGEYTKNIQLPISAAADPGIYRLKWEALYRVNPMRTVSVVVWSEPFIVAKKD